MLLKKSFILNTLGAIVISSSVQAQNAPEVIYKIHDVMPIKENNEVVSCDYSVTFYNRAPEMVSNLDLNFSWLDSVIDDQIKEEKKEKFVDSKNKVSGYTGKSKTEEYSSKKISANVSVPPLPSQKQISIKSNIKTDRCFLLLQQPDLTVNKCRYGTSSSEKQAGICKNLFVYVSPEQGDYYTEFKPISYKQEQSQTEEENTKEKEELENIYNKALDSVKRMSKTLSSM